MKSQHWAYAHLPAHLQQFSRPICELALWIEKELPQSAELNAGLRKLMEAKDCFVRAAIELHGTRSGDRMTPATNGPIDPITGRPLPAGSPYSMAHVPVTKSEPYEPKSNLHQIIDEINEEHRRNPVVVVPPKVTE